MNEIEQQTLYDENQRLRAALQVAVDDARLLQIKNEAYNDVAMKAEDALACLVWHEFEPGEDPRISDLAQALDNLRKVQ